MCTLPFPFPWFASSHEGHGRGRSTARARRRRPRRRRGEGRRARPSLGVPVLMLSGTSRRAWHAPRPSGGRFPTRSGLRTRQKDWRPPTCAARGACRRAPAPPPHPLRRLLRGAGGAPVAPNSRRRGSGGGNYGSTEIVHTEGAILFGDRHGCASRNASPATCGDGTPHPTPMRSRRPRDGRSPPTPAVGSSDAPRRRPKKIGANLFVEYEGQNGAEIVPPRGNFSKSPGGGSGWLSHLSHPPDSFEIFLMRGGSAQSGI